MYIAPKPIRNPPSLLHILEFLDIPETKTEPESRIIINQETQLQIRIIENLQNPNYLLTYEQIVWIQDIMENCPELVNEIHTEIQTILSKNGQINLHDIPKMIKIVSEVIHQKSLFCNLLHPKNILTFIKYVLHIMIDYDFFIPCEIEKIFIKTLVNNSLDLLAYHIIPPIEQEMVSCFAIFSKICIFEPFFKSETK